MSVETLLIASQAMYGSDCLVLFIMIAAQLVVSDKVHVLEAFSRLFRSTIMRKQQHRLQT